MYMMWNEGWLKYILLNIILYILIVKINYSRKIMLINC